MSTALGRQHHHAPILTPRMQVVSLSGLFIFYPFVCWYLAVILTTEQEFNRVGYRAAIGSLFRLDPLSATDSPVVTLTVTAVLTAALCASTLLLQRWIKGMFHVKHPVGIADSAAVRAAAGAQHAKDKARFSRKASVAAGLDLNTCQVSEYGLQIGTCAQEPVVLTMDDQVGIFAPTGRGKTRYLMINAVLDAPGAVVFTTTHASDMDAVITARKRVGKVYVWDPLNTAHYPEPMFWDPTAGAAIPTVAIARGTAFAAASEGTTETSSDAGKFFKDTSAQIMTRLLMTADRHGKTMQDVVEWGVSLEGSGARAVKLLRSDPATKVWGDTLVELTTGDPRTVGNIKLTLSMMLQPLLDPTVIRQMLPTYEGLEPFVAEDFVQSRDTLIILTDDNARVSVAALSTMLLNEIIDAAKQIAAVSPSDVLDPPLRIVGDEIANVAPLPKLPTMLSDSRGIGIQWVIAAQSLAQLISRWGKDDAEQILSNLNATIVLGGLQDAEALERFSKLSGTVEMQVLSYNTDQRTVISGHSVNVQEKAVLRVEEIAQLKDGQAFVLLRNSKPLLVDMIPYYNRPDGDRLTLEKAASAARRRET